MEQRASATWRRRRCRAPPSALAARERQLVGQAEARGTPRASRTRSPWRCGARATRARRARRACSAPARRPGHSSRPRAGRWRASAACRQRHASAWREEHGDRVRRWYQLVMGGIDQVGVVGQQRDDRGDVAALHRVHVARHDRLQLALAERAQRRLLARSGTRSSIDWRARCSALFTEATVVSSDSATSRAEKPSTSRRISTARCRGGSCWSAATKASSTLSRCS